MSIQPSRRQAKLPPSVFPGDRVGVAALSGAVDPERLEAGLEGLRALGFEPALAANLRRREGIFAGNDRERLDGFHALAADASVRAIVFARGGHGMLRLLPKIDWPLLSRFPRAYVGYSDLTPFLLQVVERLGLVAFHGPMVASDLADGLSADEEASLTAALAGRLPLEIPLKGALPPSSEDPATLEGPLLGGCLSLLTAILGTPYAPDLAGAMLFLEDVEEPFYRLDRMLDQLRLAGELDGVRCVLFGHLLSPRREPSCAEESAAADARLLASVVEGAAERAKSPIAWGLAAGHARPNLTLPLGCRARLQQPYSRLLIEQP